MRIVAQTAAAWQPPRREMSRPSPSSDPQALQAALRLEALGFSVIPLQPGSKLPARRWKRWQTKRPDPALLRRWWRENPAGNWGIMTGQVSGLVVLDVDGQPGRESIRGKHLPPTPTVKTPGGGFHYFFRLPPGKTWRSRAGLRPGLDVRCAGGYVVAAGSQRKDGKPWSWAIPFERREDLADPPAWLCELLEEPPRSAQEGPGAGAGEEVGVLPGELPPGVEEGARNCRAAQLIGGWLSLGLPAEEVWARVQAWNARNTPPLPESELAAVFRSIQRAEAAKPPGGRGVRIPHTLLRRGLGDGPLLLAGRVMAHYQQGGRPPAWADLAADLGVDRITVWRWRQALEKAGVTEEDLATRPRQRYFTLPAAVLFDAALTRSERVTALVLASFVTDGKAQVGQELLAQVRGLSSRWVRRDLRALEAAGYLVTSRSEYDPVLRKRGRVNTYFLRSDVARVSGSMKAVIYSPQAGPLNPLAGARRARIRATRSHNAPKPVPEGPRQSVRALYAEEERVLHDKPHEYGPAGMNCCTGVRCKKPPGAAQNAPLPERVNLPAAILRVIPYNLALEYLTERGYTEADLLAFCQLFEKGGGGYGS